MTEGSVISTEVEKSFLNIAVSGESVLGDVTITGILQAGTLQIDGFNNSINAVGAMKIQDLALGDIEFLGGLITFDLNGNIITKEITAEKYNVAGTSAGTSTLPAGDTSVFIETDQVNANSLIFVTATSTTDKTLSVSDKQEGSGFTITVSGTNSSDVNFDWFIIDHVQE